MSNYKIEGNISFYDELFKSLDDESDNEDDLVCKITGLPLEDKHVVLECNHTFNYLALYKELCRQKFDFKTYEFHLLTNKEQINIKNSNVDYFLKCPYCRNIQFKILPDYDELGLEKKYGINSLDPSLKPETMNKVHSGINYGDDNYTFTMYGVLFKKGECCAPILDKSFTHQVYKKCFGKYSAAIPNTEIYYCKFHYKKGLNDQKISEKNKLLEEKKKQLEEKKKHIEEKKKQNEESMKKNQQKIDEINKERIEKGLKPLKRIIKKNIGNISLPGQTISIFIPESVDNNNLQVCKAILKTGLNKGKPCGSKHINENFLCKKHNKN